MRRSYVLVWVGAGAFMSSCSLDGRDVGVAAGAGGASGNGGGGATAASGAGAGLGGEPFEPGAGGGGGRGGDGPLTGQSGSDGLAGGGGSPEPQLPACADQFLPQPGTVRAETLGAPGRFSLGCAAGVSDDVGIYWVAPVAGYYAIDTFGSSFDTTLGLVAPACDGSELACSDDDGTPPQSEIVREFGTGEGVVIVVDGKSGTFGEVVLNVNRVECPGIDLNLQGVPTTSSTLDGSNAHEGACGGAGRPEKAFRWSAPSAGLYRFSVTSDEMTPALYVVAGPRCAGELLGCNVGGFQSAASVVRRLEQAEVVSVIVEGTDGAGSFNLNVEDLASIAACPSQAPLDFALEPVVATLSPDDPSVLTASCAVSEQVALPNGRLPLPDHSYPVTVGGGFQCNVYITTDAPVAVYVLEGLQCGGRELVCQRVTSIGTEERIDLDLGALFSDASFDYVVVVESTDPLTGPASYTLQEVCFII